MVCDKNDAAARNALQLGGVQHVGRKNVVFAERDIVAASFTRLLPLLQSAAGTRLAAAGARLAAEKCPRGINPTFRVSQHARQAPNSCNAAAASAPPWAAARRYNRMASALSCATPRPSSNMQPNKN
jgi:hypothetical protein